MNKQVSARPVFWQLVRKDWYLVAWPLVALLLAGLASIVVLSINHWMTFLVGSILLISVVVLIGVVLVFGSVVNERSQKTLALVMSLPITAVQYTAAKLVSNVGVFTLAWQVLLGSTVVAILTRDNLPDGLIPFAVIVLGQLYVAYAITVAVALISESELWTIVVFSAFNISISIFMNLMGRLSEIGSHMEGPVPVWNATALGIIAVEWLIVAGAVAVTLWVQSRKTDFL